ncbi:hypothetical protein [Catellatospora sp. NPDC049133]|uniref:hypothetical protein n=1 Tax=Catellatospora sp. NPDC049133 TaxID=3155499 RepID=UPI0033C678D2
MGNSYMYPVLRTPDLAEAYALAQRLLRLANQVDEVEVWATTTGPALHRYTSLTEAGLSAQTPASRSAEMIAALGTLLPDPDRRLSRGRDTLWAHRLDVRAAEPLRHLDDVRIDLFVMRAVPGAVEERFLAAVGSDVGSVYWDVEWPEVDELDLDLCVKYAGVEITVNSAEPFEERYSGDHTVWIHTRADERAQWLAERAGAKVLGPWVLGR